MNQLSGATSISKKESNDPASEDFCLLFFTPARFFSLFWQRNHSKQKNDFVTKRPGGSQRNSTLKDLNV